MLEVIIKDYFTDEIIEYCEMNHCRLNLYIKLYNIIY